MYVRQTLARCIHITSISHIINAFCPRWLALLNIRIFCLLTFKFLRWPRSFNCKVFSIKQHSWSDVLQVERFIKFCSTDDIFSSDNESSFWIAWLVELLSDYVQNTSKCFISWDKDFFKWNLGKFIFSHVFPINLSPFNKILVRLLSIWPNDCNVKMVLIDVKSVLIGVIHNFVKLLFSFLFGLGLVVRFSFFHFTLFLCQWVHNWSTFICRVLRFILLC